MSQLLSNLPHLVSDTVGMFSVVPAPTVSIVASRSAPVYAGTSFNLTCDFTLSPSVDTYIDAVLTWRVIDAAVNIFTHRITTSGKSLSFSPVATSDSGNYTCEVTVNKQEYISMERPGESPAVQLTVEGKE